MSVSPQTTEGTTPSSALRVLVLGPLRLLLKTDEFHMPFPSDGSHNAFWESMLQRFPEMRGSRGAVRLARNSRFLSSHENLSPGDEIALIPPVSGG